MTGNIKIMWLSRHEMTRDQEEDLRRIFGENIIVNHVLKRVSSWQEVVALGVCCDVFAVVLPPSILGDLVNNTNIPVIRAKANRVPTGRKILSPATGKLETEYRFEHAGWERVVRLEIITEKL